jgi:hypothetical protein
MELGLVARPFVKTGVSEMMNIGFRKAKQHEELASSSPVLGQNN